MKFLVILLVLSVLRHECIECLAVKSCFEVVSSLLEVLAVDYTITVKVELTTVSLFGSLLEDVGNLTSLLVQTCDEAILISADSIVLNCNVNRRLEVSELAVNIVK